MDEVCELVGGHIIDEIEWHLHQAPIEADMALPSAASPLGLGIGQGEAGRHTPEASSQFRHPPREHTAGLRLQPGAYKRFDVDIEWAIDIQGTAAAVQAGKQGRMDFEHERMAQIADLGACHIRCGH